MSERIPLWVRTLLSSLETEFLFTGNNIIVEICTHRVLLSFRATLNLLKTKQRTARIKDGHEVTNNRHVAKRISTIFWHFKEDVVIGRKCQAIHYCKRDARTDERADRTVGL